jgi:hypothetical protein
LCVLTDLLSRDFLRLVGIAHDMDRRDLADLDRGEALEDAHASEIRRRVLWGREVQ